MEELGGKVVWFPSFIDSWEENEWLMIQMDETFIYRQMDDIDDDIDG